MKFQLLNPSSALSLAIIFPMLFLLHPLSSFSQGRTSEGVVIDSSEVGNVTTHPVYKVKSKSNDHYEVSFLISVIRPAGFLRR